MMRGWAVKGLRRGRVPWLVGAALAATGGWAQVPSGALAEAGAGDIIVTARKREERLQDVPLSVTAVTEQTIERQGLRSVMDIADVTPGLSFRQAFGRNFDRPVIRGMSNIQGAPNAAFFIDGVFVVGPLSGFNVDNLERVEVIRGPQSALFGRATFAGAINFVTRAPGNTPAGRVTTSLGADGLKELSGFVSGPLVRDRLAVEVNGRIWRFDGQYENLADPVEKLGREESDSVGVTLRATPTDSLTLTARVGYQADRDGHFPIALLGRVIGQTLPVPGQLVNNGALTCFLPEIIGLGPPPALRPVARTRTRGYFCGEIPTPRQYALNTDVYRIAGFPHGLERELIRTSLKVETRLGDWLLQGIGAWNRFEQIAAVDQDYTERRVLAFETITGSGARDVSGEIRLLSPADRRLRGLAGAYVYFERSLPENFSAALTFPGPPPRPWVRGDDPARIVRNRVFDNEVDNRGIFGQVQFEILPRLTLSAEGRYQEETLRTSGTSTATVGTTVFTRQIEPPLGVATYRSFLPRFTADWKARDGLLLYAVAAKGNKPGGFNSGAYSAIYDDAEVARLVQLGLDRFDEEEAWSYEGGIKAELFDRRLALSLAGYYVDWKNQQLTQTIQVQRRDGVLGSLSFTSNVGKSRVAGLEFEALYRPTDWLDLRAGYALADTKIQDFVTDDQADLYITAQDLADLNARAPLPNFQAPGTPGFAQYLAALAAAAPARFAAVNELLARRGNARGNRLPRAPMHMFNLGGTASYPLFERVSGFLAANLSYESRRYVQVDNLAWSGDSWNLNLRGGFERDGWLLVVFVTNALNDRTPVDVLRSIDTGQTLFRPALRPGEATAFLLGQNVSSANIRDFAVTPPRLRNVGVTVQYRF
ncbi:MAG: TonB-dependent receptor [Sphingomonadaceae bacterium]|uniref:TonB-dependent receptor n=1 Tax=Thermaurantiacus sp. TaxID=2820283 RepID=UPI00298EE815|nr:TonB-dependent receptor [Thermaurantiacus sp.]MCS6987302.1 TonB-dependent receptor [Sphingomonadaceae bacterium]MDW8414522.1 TonB-dependent receptor [Thermaurantiacus sp.]